MMCTRILLLLAVLAITHVGGKECPPQLENHTGAPYFTTDTPNDHVTVRVGHFAELECCMQGTKDVMWAKLDAERGEWETLNSTNMDENRVEFINNRQTLLFKSVEEEDEGAYMCFVGVDVSRKFSIDVVACDPLARGPYAIAPLPCENTVCNVGEDLSLPCNAYFGCDTGGDNRLVEWYVSRDETEDSDWVPASEFDSRYQVKVAQSGNGTEIRANLTIRSVRLYDTRRRFKCLLASAQIIHGQSNIIVKLTTRSDDRLKMDLETSSVTLVTIAGSVGAVVIVLIVFLGVTVVQARKTRKHVSEDIERKLSNDMRPLHFKDSRYYNDDVI